MIKNKVTIMRNVRRKNYFTNYKFLKKYENLLFIGLNDEYEDLKKEVPNLEFSLFLKTFFNKLFLLMIKSINLSAK